MTKFRDLLWYFLNIRDEESAAAFLREKGVFHRERSCPSCHHQMVLCSRGPNVCPQWRCRNSPCHARLSTRKGTWFEGSRRRLSLEKAIGLIVAWSDELSSLKFCKKHLGLDKSTTVRWNRDLRAVAAEAVGEVSRPIGGPSKTVALDATLFCSGKHNRGWPYARQQWIFGGTCHETGESFVVLVNNRSTATLLPIILRHVQPGTTIVTDEWRAYRCLAQDEFKHVCVNHSLNFVEPSIANSATAPKLGTCPSTNVTVSKNIPCTNDSVCSGEQKCCETSSGLMCVDPKELSEKPKPGDCPQVYLHPSKWGSNHQCLGDSQCSGNMKCCPHERGRMCRRPPGFPAESKPGKCRIVACSSPLARVKSCYSDRSCAGNLKCCPTTSGGAVCRTPVY
ncbi:hypothetical protein M514_05074 [Trichuris suis]|uniref:WAP domain-containing protein n=1 Tax=Trichuris suis TaxID=68888 RepID=A0A085NCS0_9BILA|nr:hypothetical protein M514_05074 [Trichuris suis]